MSKYDDKYVIYGSYWAFGQKINMPYSENRFVLHVFVLISDWRNVEASQNVIQKVGI